MQCLSLFGSLVASSVPALQWSRQHRLLVRSVDRRSRVCSIHIVQDQIWEAAEKEANIIESVVWIEYLLPPAVDALPRQEQRGLYEPSLQPFLPTAWTNQDLLCFYCLCFALLSFIGPAWRWNVHLYCLLATSMPRSIRCMHRKSKRIPFVCLLLPYTSMAWLPFSLYCVCCTGNIHMMDKDLLCLAWLPTSLSNFAAHRLHATG